MLGFALGFAAAISLTIVSVHLVSHLRGPVVGYWELGTPRYARDQAPIDIGAGLLIALQGLGVGIVSPRMRLPRSFGVGGALTPSLLGLAVATS